MVFHLYASWTVFSETRDLRVGLPFFKLIEHDVWNWYAGEIVWGLAGTYIDKRCAICFTKVQNQQLFCQQAPAGKVKFSSSAASDLNSSQRLLHELNCGELTSDSVKIVSVDVAVN